MTAATGTDYLERVKRIAEVLPEGMRLEFYIVLDLSLTAGGIAVLDGLDPDPRIDRGEVDEIDEIQEYIAKKKLELRTRAASAPAE